MTGLYVDGDSVLHRLHPLTKIAVVAAALLLAFAVEGRREGPMGLLMVLLAAAGAAGVLRPLVAGLLRTVLPILVSLYLLHAVLALARGDVDRGGDWSLVLHRLMVHLDAPTPDGPASIGLRLLVVVAAMLLVLLTTHPGRLTQAIVARGGPVWLGYVVAAAMHTVPAALAQVRSVSDAQRVRGFDPSGGVLKRAASILPLLAPVMLGMLQSVEEQAMALEARGYARAGPRTSLVAVEEEPWEPGLRVAALALGVVGFLWLRGWFGWGLSWLR